MTLESGTIGVSLARDTAYHLFDPSHRSDEKDMNYYLRNDRYSFVPEMAKELKLNPDQLLIDCILADGLDAGVIRRVGWDYIGYDEVDTDDAKGLGHRHLREKTQKRLIAVNSRAKRMGTSVLEYVDKDADWDLRSMQASWRICEISVEGNLRKDGRPYSQHPLEATAILYESIKRVQESGHKIPRKEVIALLSTCLMHDSVEDWVVGANHYSNDPNVSVVSPLVILQVLQRTGLSGTLPNYVANATRLMTHEKGQPWMHSYEEYIDRLSSNFLSAIVKPVGDNYHNYQVDRLPDPTQKNGESEKEFLTRFKKYKDKQITLANIIFRNGITGSPNRKNAYRHDKRAIDYGHRVLFAGRGIVEREGDRERYPHVDWRRAVLLDRFKSDVLPEFVENLLIDFQMPDTTL